MKYLIPVFAFVLFTACGNQPTETADENGGWFGEEFEFTETVSASEVAALLKEGSSNEFIVEGVIEECCQKKGCWMTVAMDNGETMRVSFKDYGFFVPLEAGGKSMTMKGIAAFDTIPVDMLKHLAEDAKKTQEEIDAITEPEFALTFEATGVLIK